MSGTGAPAKETLEHPLFPFPQAGPSKNGLGPRKEPGPESVGVFVLDFPASHKC